jgi:hypothetical protein
MAEQAANPQHPAPNRETLEALPTFDATVLRLLLSRRMQHEAVAAGLLDDAVCAALEKLQAGQICQAEPICE